MPSAADDLTQASWQAFSRLLDEALELPATERSGWLDGLGPEHEALKPALRAVLLRSNGVETAQWLATLPHTASGSIVADESDLKPEARVGPYRLLREIGIGGMGAVWLAERADGTLKRQVALKLPRASWRRGLAERMARERDILAALEHPHIARLYDAGTDAQGRPFLALEYVEGRPIDAYCKERALGVQARLALMLQVAHAVAFAHSRLVVHRDLKPSNILVTADGQVRLLDFGIAKLMEGDRARETQLTQIAGRALTLDYASPEQIGGEPVGTASDVYSLGVVAYELLAGAKPYKLKRPSAAALEEAIAAVDAPLASATATDVQTKKELKGDLDAILNKALKKHPEERYATVNSFAEDLGRFARGEAVLARRDSRWYRLSRLVRRNRVSVAAGTAVLVALSAGAIVATWQARLAQQQAQLARQQADVATKEAKRAAAVETFLLDIFRANSGQQADPLRAQRTTARELLDIGAARVAESLKDEPEVQLAVRATLAEMYVSLGLNGRAAEIGEESLALARRTYGDRSARLAEFLLGYVATLQERSQRERVPQLLQEALDVLDAAGDSTSMTRGNVLLETAWYFDGESIARSREAADAAVAFFVQHHAGARELVTAHITAGRARSNAGDHVAAERHYRAAVDAARRRGETGSRLLHDALNHLGDAQRGQLKFAEAEASYREALQHALRTYGPERGETLVTQARLASLLLVFGRRAEAEAARDGLRSTIARPDSRLDGGWREAVIGLLSEPLSDLGRPDLAEPLLRAEVEDLRDKFPRAGVTARGELRLADVLVAMGRLDEASEMLGVARNRWSLVAEGSGPLPVDSMFTLGTARLALARGRPDEALAAIAAAKEAIPAQQLWLAIERSNALRVSGRPAEAAQAAGEAVRELDGRPAGERPRAIEAAARLALGEALAGQGDVRGARVQLQQAVDLRAAFDEPGSRELVRAARALTSVASASARSAPPN